MRRRRRGSRARARGRDIDKTLLARHALELVLAAPLAEPDASDGGGGAPKPSLVELSDAVCRALLEPAAPASAGGGAFEAALDDAAAAADAAVAAPPPGELPRVARLLEVCVRARARDTVSDSGDVV